MKETYRKTRWQDNRTPVNAANLNNMENAIENLYEHSLSHSQFKEGPGISIKPTEDGKDLEFSCDDSIMRAGNINRIEYVMEKVNTDPENCSCPCCVDSEGRDIMTLKGVLLLVLDRYSKKLKYIVLNGIKIFEVEKKNEME